MINPKKLFSEKEHEMIKEAVHNAEMHTSGEIATMAVSSSDEYREGIVLSAVILVTILGIMFGIIFRQHTIWFFIPVAFILYFPVYYFCRLYPSVTIIFTHGKRVKNAVQERAVRAFYEKGLYRTSESNGILIFISELEHKTWILGDKGINERISQDEWSTIATTLAKGFQHNRCEALCIAIASCGVILSQHFPAVSHGANELSDDVLFDN
ncbi:MAG: TPM domain-containing protein [Desulfuromonadales bacterium]|nr:TPM domain-containing protein [Desulfuromonadales bacterium]